MSSGKEQTELEFGTRRTARRKSFSLFDGAIGLEYQFESIGPILRWIALAFLFVGILAAVAVAAGIAALPGWLAHRRNHPQATAINICGWFGLPTGVLWVVAMVWAFLEREPESDSGGSPTAAEIQQLQDQIRELGRLVQSLEESSR